MSPKPDLNDGFRLGEWEVRPAEGLLTGPAGQRHLQPKSMDVLMCLVEHRGQVVKRDDILHQVWGQRAVTDEPLTRCIGELRKSLGDTREHPAYVQTIPKRGYQIIAPVTPLHSVTEQPPPDEPPTSRKATLHPRTWAALLMIGATVAFFVIALQPDRDAKTEPAIANDSIAVLAFEDMSSDASHGWLGRGIAEDLLNLLAQIDGLEVASRTSSFQPEMTTLDIRDIGQKLRVHYVLEGSIRRSKNRIKIAAQLIDAETGYHLWSEVYDRTTSDLFAIQGEIADRVVKQLQLEMPLTINVGTRFTDNVEAYDYYLQARSILLRRPSSNASLENAARLFNRSLEFDADFGLSYAGLCAALVQQIEAYHASFIDTARVACERGIALAPDTPVTHSALGWYYLLIGDGPAAQREFEWVVRHYPHEVDARLGLGKVLASEGNDAAAESTLREALEISPDYAASYASLGHFLFQRGHWREAIPVYQRSVEIEPGNTSAYNNLGAAYYMAGEFELAIDAYREVIRRQPTPLTYSNLGTSYYHLARFEDAEIMYQEAISLAPNDPILWGNLADALSQIPGHDTDVRTAYVRARLLADEQLAVNPGRYDLHAAKGYYCSRLGDTDCAEKHTDTALNLTEADPYTYYLATLVAIESDRREQAIDYMARALELGYPHVLLNADPLLNSLQGNQRLAALATP